MRYDTIYWKDEDIDNKIANVIPKRWLVKIGIEQSYPSKGGNGKTKT